MAVRGGRQGVEGGRVVESGGERVEGGVVGERWANTWPRRRSEGERERRLLV